jgi:hypothetical protein
MLLDNLATEALVAAVVAAYFDCRLRADARYALDAAIREVNKRLDELVIEICGSAGRKYNLYLSWTVECLTECRNVVKQIEIEKVAELLKQRQKTTSVFEKKLSRVADAIDRSTSGVMACYKEIVTNPSNYDVRVVALMGSVKRNAKAIKRVISWLRRPPVRWLIFELRPLYLVVGAICLFLCIYTLSIYHSAPTIDPGVIRESAASDAGRLADIWRERDVGPFKKLSDTAELLYHLGSIAPLILLLCTVPLYGVRRFVIKSGSTRSKLEEMQIHLVNTARMLGVKRSLINFEEVNVKTVTTTVSGQGNIVNVAEYMQAVSNQVSGNLKTSSSPDEVKELVRQLTDQINAIADRVEPALAEKMGKGVKRISEEMAEPKPDRAWYELSLKGLKEAAEAVGRSPVQSSQQSGS